ncbi:unnamed protein product [Kluyveromyces dobzhanskii CBS 2104]|uniref:chitin synthase n=1 Tax=Kluyveromyces dobzhanskii CBS 2104 TaxID=1427455 RepID=A0A0A8L3A1_9SACH|nr:unnamed protein product [Kluyveromyces dobzhanskii CBS 2104]
MTDDYYAFDNESLLKSRSQGQIARRGSLVRPERNSFKDPTHPYHYYAQKAKETNVQINPSTTGALPEEYSADIPMQDLQARSDDKLPSSSLNTVDEFADADGQLQTRDDDRFDKTKSVYAEKTVPNSLEDENGRNAKGKGQQKVKTGFSLWQSYCFLITIWAPSSVLKLFGMRTKAVQRAWRDKIGLISIIFYIGAIVAFLTFGFTRTVCKPSKIRIRNNQASTGQLIIHGQAYSLTSSSHPEAAGIPGGSNVLYPPVNAGGMDGSFLFQNVNGNCKGLIQPRDNSSIPFDDDGNMAWYFPCKLVNQNGTSTPNFTESEYYSGWGCHTSTTAREQYYSLNAPAEIFFSWDDIKNSSRKLIVYNGDVIDLGILDWLQTDDLTYPGMFDVLKSANLDGYDISLVLSTAKERKVARCLVELAKVGVIDSETIGCIASKVVLYLSLVFILSVVGAKFFIACYFHYFVARKQGVDSVDNRQLAKHNNDLEDWSENINTLGPLKPVDPSLRPMKKNHKKNNSSLSLFNRKSRFSQISMNKSVYLNDPVIQTLENSGMTTMTIQSVLKSAYKNEMKRKSTQAGFTSQSRPVSTINPFADNLDPFGTSMTLDSLDPTIIHPDVVLQPPPDFMPYGYPLVHTLCCVTCYSEDEVGLRTTLDSIATTDYPNSHKVIVVICDGIIKGSGNDKTTPDIVLDMMEDFVVPKEQVVPHPYVAIAVGSKRHNMAKIYAGFYKYDDSTIPTENQQRVPIITIVKCGTAEEQGSAKPGNRGKRDSQIILMSFLQNVTFDERMSALEFQLMKNIWQITGLMANFYETVLMVDADTKVFPDSLTHMLSEMVNDPLIMGLCGETKIANKSESWVSAIQVFEYFISHHQSKAFESVFGSVTCLPGCFSIYRIKTPKGKDGFWVPILANPDIVERYSDNVTDTLHKKNLLLLGEDRFLSSLLLKTFPKRKTIFVPKAACKTIVPASFKVLLSQRRRWINSTVHNLMELVLVKDLCGTFCFSMQFIIAMELVGTLVLPLAICFTIYVIIFSIVSHPTPVITLVLLGLILGLPGVLIIVTASRWSYLMWMLCYIIALPVWNLIFPTYSYWKFDDFSWGETRVIDGETKPADENEGEFDHSKIKMRTWREFERLEKANRKQASDDESLNTVPGPSQFMDNLFNEESNTDNVDERLYNGEL